MELVADLHLHSRFSRATSSELDLEHLHLWAQRKGIQIVGSADFTHPGWFAELEAKLSPAEEGLYRLRPELEAALEAAVPPACASPVRFLLSTEISNIYKRGERTRKVHNLVLLPSLEAASALSRALARIGNLASDGRPILGLDSRDLLELVLESSNGRGLLIPAHIWTPWFSALGSRSGFDSIAECYRDLEPEILAVETGLSSDPPMNHRLSSLDRYALVSSSDAHSPQKLGREATLFDCEVSYGAIREALATRRGLAGTLEFFPEEGKYHFDGHRKCGVRLAPAESRARGGACPVCGRPLTLGVMYRVEELADRPEGVRPERAAPFTSLTGLAEVLAEVQGVGAGSVSVLRARDLLCARLGPELAILRALPEEELRREGGALLAEAIARMRRGEVETEGGYDGEFGRVHLLRAEERGALAGQSALFASLPAPRRRRERSAAATADHQPVARDAGPEPPPLGASLDLFARLPAPPDPLAELADDQRAAAAHCGSPSLIVAGPGTGKTHTLTRRIASRILSGVPPARVLAVTFTVKAAGEMRTRLAALLGEERARAIRVSTFHALALAILDDARARSGQPPLAVLGEPERAALLAEVFVEVEPRDRVRIGELLARPGSEPALEARFRAALEARGAIELDALCPEAVRALAADAPLLARWRERARTVCVDEYQDLNQAQYELVRLLCPADDPALDLCVIGDPDQAIYGFRGADPRYFLRFAEDYPGATRFALERSYRSPRVVLEAAAALIANNRERLPTRTRSDLLGPPRVSVLRAEDAEAEAELVVARIERALGGVSLLQTEGDELEALSPAEIAVLFRTRAQADALRRALERSGVPYRSSAGRNGTEELEPVLAFLRGALADEGAGALADEGAEARELHELRRASEALPAREALALLCDALCRTEELEAARAAAARLAALLYDPRGAGLASFAPALLSLCATCAEPDALGGEAVSLLTLHAAKGLEFSSVTIVGCEEGLLPALRPELELEEERRLLYVGMTRARRTLTLTWAARRGAGLRTPSRFLDELPADLLARESPRPRARRPQLSLFR
jgi:DNA helicase-2/ATP-dependent DNA helicase PcrA